MKNLLLITLITLISTAAFSQSSEYIEEIKVSQDEWNIMFSDPETSPLPKEEVAAFHGLEFFPINENYRIEAEFVSTPGEKPFEMVTTTERRPMYVKYGEARFELNGKKIKLDIYQNINLVLKDEYKDHLFLPYKDWTNGEESYGGGRYIDLKQPEGNIIILDFNKSYNPYCAYNDRYSCPVPPKENHMELEIRAGVKKYH